MSDAGNPFGFGKLVPGFDFLQNLVTAAAKGTGTQASGLSSWIAPTLSVEDLERRIGELKAVSFWLDQNAKALAATIQALEVQKMTLSTLRGMNVAMGDVAKAFTIRPAEPAAAGAAAQDSDRRADSSAAKQAAKVYAKSFESAPPAPRSLAGEPAAPAGAAAAASASGEENEAGAPADSAAKPSGAAAAMVDPMQWWGALTGQFQQIAANAMRDAAGNPALQASRDIATNAFKSANEMTSSLTQAARKDSAAATQDGKKEASARKTAATKKTARKTAPKNTAKGE